jgi:hypothetical protein
MNVDSNYVKIGVINSVADGLLASNARTELR